MASGPAVIRDRQHRFLHRLPEKWRAFAELARFDRPIGTWLLFWPCLWGVVLAAGPVRWWLMPLFAIGAVAMRGAGCTINDLADRRLDAAVERTRTRPLPSGRVSVAEALAFVALQCLVGALILLPMNGTAIVVAVASLPLVVLYPFMKRITYWPQLFLGLAFNWGALVGYAAAGGEPAWPALALYAGAIAWTIGYDTIYAHQDKEDDALIGIRSTALRLGEASPAWLLGFYAVFISLLAVAAIGAGLGWPFFALLPVVAFSLWRQLRGWRMDDPADCLRRFRMNREAGLAVFLALVLGRLLA